MIQLPRVALRFFALAFGVYHGVLGLLSLGFYRFPGLAVTAVVLYILALFAAVFSFPGLKLREYLSWLVLAVGIYVPFLVSGAHGGIAPQGYSTWHIAGVATLMGVITVRQHAIMGWTGVSILIAQTLLWGGPELWFNSGVSGAFLLVLAAQAASTLLSSSSIAAREFLEKSIITSAQTAATSAANEERQRRIQETLANSLPVLEQIVRKGGALNKAQRAEAALTEIELRDQIRGRSLQHPALNQAVRAARGRGVQVQLLDDGGLDGLSEGERDALLTRVASELKSVKQGKVFIRAVLGDGWRLTVAAVVQDQEKPQLFLRL